MSRDAERDPDDTPGGMPPSDSDTLTSELRDRLRYVEGQLDAERQAHAEARRIIAGLVARIPPQLEAPSEARESTETASADPDREQQPPRSATGRAREEASERPWRRRAFGG